MEYIILYRNMPYPPLAIPCTLLFIFFPFFYFYSFLWTLYYYIYFPSSLLFFSLLVSFAINIEGGTIGRTSPCLILGSSLYCTYLLQGRGYVGMNMQYSPPSPPSLISLYLCQLCTVLVSNDSVFPAYVYI
ncbi:hypothetical protein L211DRAFT_347669 [Terfezia boudieri ATCC MYA-4762]|uniref:Uncharacterized protein n=1 Tax=Terfezia boudieri ATCC MYA-4762 TaxID=1051890 RepID=A0A3N4L920_9PEZI|nr:hypothetical protein L211DRAFT_347669 [Terfezia boudieri ATCC MYA-4762]